MHVGDFVTIHGPRGTWENALLTSEEQEEVFKVWHPCFQYELAFSQQADEQGYHYNVGNAAYWIVPMQEERP